MPKVNHYPNARTAKTWVAKVRNVYSSIEELKAYDALYGVARRCGFMSANALWESNCYIGGSNNPNDFGRASEKEIEQLSKKS